MRHLLKLLPILLFFWSCGITETKQPPEQIIKVLSTNTKEQGYGINVVAEVKNMTSKPMKYVGVEFSCYDSNGKIIDSGIGAISYLGANGTAVVDRYFSDVPEGVNFKVKPVEYNFQ